MEGEMQWFSNEEEFLEYINTYMKEARRRRDSMQLTVRDNRGEVIAKWDYNGSGQVFEKRSKERLDNERL